MRAEQTGREAQAVSFRIENGEIAFTVSNLGARVCELYTKDKEGRFGDVLLGLKNVTDCFSDGSCAGAVVGRVANRIADGRFRLNGRDWQLSVNNGSNHLHGGKKGFDRRYFDWEEQAEGIRFTYLSKDGEEGYPGNLKIQVTYLLEDDTLRILYDAVSDADTLLNPTSHMYFNLDGSDSVLDHELMIAAEKMVPVRPDGIPEGPALPVAGTPFDFRVFRRIGDGLSEENPQLAGVGGYDHPFLLDRQKDAVLLKGAESGRCVCISTDMPAVHLYSGNFLQGTAQSKKGRPFRNREGVALETQYLPDSIHREPDSPTILRAGKPFHSETSYRFRIG